MVATATTPGNDVAMPELGALSATQFLTFAVAGESYAISVLSVREIIRYDEETVTRVPSASSVVRGVINLRGSVVSVVDLSVQFGLGETEVTKWTCIVIVEAMIDGELAVIGLVVESINQVLDILPDNIEPPPAFGTHVDTDCVVGMGRYGKKFLIILDIERILTMDMLTGANSGGPEDQADSEDEAAEETPDGAAESETSADSLQDDEVADNDLSNPSSDDEADDDSGLASDELEDAAPGADQEASPDSTDDEDDAESSSAEDSEDEPTPEEEQ